MAKYAKYAILKMGYMEVNVDATKWFMIKCHVQLLNDVN